MERDREHLEHKVELVKGIINQKIEDRLKREDQFKKAIHSCERKIIMLEKKLIDQSSSISAAVTPLPQINISASANSSIDGGLSGFSNEKFDQMIEKNDKL